ncbi:cytochrome c [endosymbiont of Lamellibrachia barhami]|uniref:cytochrome c n=1 Tax=endosymbiont of Lamellibrachia barhami TaxID=205975 RepID=UPI0015AB2D72|nr:cytochrome c [endosymbiont of Lamellibrachia barhami]
MCKTCWTITALMLIVILGMAYKFIVVGSVEQATDGRLSLQLEPAEKDLVMAEMRAFLVTVQQINEGVVQDDMKKVADAARKVGRAAQEAVPVSLMGKLPLDFKKLGFDTHTKFDSLALDAEQFGDKEQTLGALAELMQNCISCHAGYRIDLVVE